MQRRQIRYIFKAFFSPALQNCNTRNYIFCACSSGNLIRRERVSLRTLRLHRYFYGAACLFRRLCVFGCEDLGFSVVLKDLQMSPSGRHSWPLPCPAGVLLGAHGPALGTSVATFRTPCPSAASGSRWACKRKDRQG